MNGGNKVYRNIALTLVCLILGIMLAWQFKSVNYNEKVASNNNKRAEQLRDELLAEKQKVEALTKRNEELKKENMEYENNRGNITLETKTLKTELERARIIAGLVPVKGKGLTITIDKKEDTYIDDSDILSVINELRASDAQAISVNGERIVAMSEIRVAGRFIMINQKQLLPPFEIRAIAEPDKVEHALRIIDGAIERLEAYGLNVNVQKADELVIPAVRDDGSVIRTNMLTPVKQ